MRLIATLKNKRDPRMAEVSTIEELAPPGKKNLLSALYAAENIGRSIVLPQGFRRNESKFFAMPFAAMTKDPQFLKEAEKNG